MKTIGYIRVSMDTQDPEKQRHLLLEHAQQNRLIIDEFIEVEMSSRKTPQERKIGLLLLQLEEGDQLLVAELSRLGRNMLETLNIINALSEQGIRITFVRQPELSTSGPHAKLLLAIYSYFAEAERDYISLRTKQGLAAAKANGQQLGRPKGSRNKKGRALDPFREEILEYLAMGIPLTSIRKIINPRLEKPMAYNTYWLYVSSDEELSQLTQSLSDATE